MLTSVLLLVCFAAVAQQSSGYVAQSRTSNDNSRPDDTFDASQKYAFILLGATGDLSKREIYPNLWHLYRDNLLPKNTKIFGYARSKYTVDGLRKNAEPYVKVEPSEEKLYDEFWSLNTYIGGTGNEDTDYEIINKTVGEFEGDDVGNRLFYLALPPAVFPSATSQIKRVGMADNGWTKVVVEKPFGRDSDSAEELSQHLSKLFREDQIYRMDHFLNYEMVQNIFTLRFANRMFTPAWNRENIASVEIDFRENIGVEGRGSFFDPNSIIRDVMQNHLLQMMSLIAMERPKSIHNDHIRDAKVELLKNTREIMMDDVVIGQYVANPDSKDPRERIGYRDDPTVPDDSISSTFALTVLKVDNERWKDVPFILRAGKGLNINQTAIIVQFKNVTGDLFNSRPKRNNLIFVAKGTEGLHAKITSKVPGFSDDLDDITLDFTYEETYKGIQIPEAYEKALLAVFRGDQLHFVRTDEVTEAWRIFTPILHEIERKEIRPTEYKFGTTGPLEADEMENNNNFIR